MESRPGDRFVWLCPACARRVPRRVDECRCGFRQADLPPGLPSAENTPAGSDGQRKLMFAAAAVAAIVAVLYLWPANVPSAASADATGQGTPVTYPAPPAELSTEGPDAVPHFPSMPAIAPVTPQGAIQPLSPAVPTASASLEDVVSRVLPAVVSIDAGTARGTGFFIGPDKVLTNAHVVQGQPSVRLHVGGAVYTARVASVSTGTDLALLHVHNPNQRQATLRLGSVGSTRAGQEVIAIGSALGVLSNTVTRGIVSAVRQAGAVTLIQTDAAINPGNSGGPLVDRAGVVIGINSIGVAPRSAQGVAFAVAADHARSLLNGQPAASAQTPLAALNQAMGGPSETDARRTRGEQDYERVVQWAARSADQLDTFWHRYAASCVAASTATGDRPWFAALEPNGVRINVTSGYDCEGWLRTVVSNAGQMKTEMDAAGAAARHAGVYPGAVRGLRQRYRLQWNGWER